MKNLIKLSILAAIALLIPRSSGRPPSDTKNKSTRSDSSDQSNITQAHQNTAIEDPKVK